MSRRSGHRFAVRTCEQARRACARVAAPAGEAV